MQTKIKYDRCEGCISNFGVTARRNDEARPNGSSGRTVSTKVILNKRLLRFARNDGSKKLNCTHGERSYTVAPVARKTISGITVFLFLFAFTAHSQNLGNIGKAKPFHISGNLSAGFNTYTTNDSIKTMNPFQWSISGSPVISIYGFSLPFNIFISSQDKGFSTPFTRFGVSPYYKWAKLHLGWRSLNFNQYTLGGQQILGAGFELTPGNLDVAFMYGRFNHAVTDISVYNNLNNNVPVYNRNGYAFKLGYGNEKAKISFSYLRAKDKAGFANPKIVDSPYIAPAANQAFGIKGQVTFLKHFIFQTEGAISVYTRDMNADSVDLRENKSNFLLKSGIVSHPNASTSLATAINASLGYSLPAFSLALEFQRIDPDYKSMGAFYLQTDIEQYTLAPSFRLWQNKLFVSGSFGFQRNNLGKHLSTSSVRKIGMINVSLNPNQTFGIDVQYSNYGISQQVLSQFKSPSPSKPSVYDSVRISNVSQSISLSPHVSLVSEKSVQVFSLNASLQNLTDNNKLNKGADNYTSITATLNHDWELLRKNWDINQTLAYINTKTSVNKVGSAGYTLSLTKLIVHKTKDSTGKQENSNRISLTASGTYYLNLLNNKSNGSSMGINIGVNYQFLKRHSISAGIGWIGNHPPEAEAGAKNRNELTTFLRYNFSF